MIGTGEAATAPGAVMTAAELTAFLAEVFPQVAAEIAVEETGAAVTGAGDPAGILRVRLRVAEKHLRPGGTVSGPTIFLLADVAMYLALLARIGPQALAVTTNCAIDFMRKPAPGADLLAEARILKLGRVLAVGDVLVFSDGLAAPVARAGLTYSIPPR